MTKRPTFAAQRRSALYARLVAAYLAGSTLAQCAAAEGCSMNLTWRALRAAGIPRRKRGAPIGANLAPGWRERLDRIAAARASGQTLEQIGKAEGVTRERIRQLLHKHGDPALIGRVSAPCRRPPELAACEHCDAQFVVRKIGLPNHWTRRFCSKACSREWWWSHNPRDLSEARGPIISAMRMRGHQWWKIAAYFGVSPNSVFMQVKRWANRHQVDISHCFTYRARMDRQSGRDLRPPIARQA